MVITPKTGLCILMALSSLSHIILPITSSDDLKSNEVVVETKLPLVTAATSPATSEVVFTKSDMSDDDLDADLHDDPHHRHGPPPVAPAPIAPSRRVNEKSDGWVSPADHSLLLQNHY
jgi:hypothetical protein